MSHKLFIILAITIISGRLGTEASWKGLVRARLRGH